MITEQGKIRWFGAWEDAQSELPTNVEIQHYPEQLIIPGMIDTHIHFPQTEMVGAVGTAAQLVKYIYLSNRNPISRQSLCARNR